MGPAEACAKVARDKVEELDGLVLDDPLTGQVIQERGPNPSIMNKLSSGSEPRMMMSGDNPRARHAGKGLHGSNHVTAGARDVFGSSRASRTRATLTARAARECRREPVHPWAQDQQKRLRLLRRQGDLTTSSLCSQRRTPPTRSHPPSDPGTGRRAWLSTSQTTSSPCVTWRLTPTSLSQSRLAELKRQGGVTLRLLRLCLRLLFGRLNRQDRRKGIHQGSHPLTEADLPPADVASRTLQIKARQACELLFI